MPSNYSLSYGMLLALPVVVTLGGHPHAEELGNWTVETIQAPGRDAPEYRKQLTLRDAIGRSLAYNPSIRAAYKEIDAREGEAFQSSRRPNPELLLEAENFGGSGETQSFEAAELTASLTQLIELGGKRMLRLQAAQLDTSLATWDFEAVRVQVATLAAQAFVDVLTAQERVKVLREFVDVAEKTRASVELRVNAGKASPIELDKAVVSVARAKALVSAEKVRIDVAKRRLSTFWGGQAADFGSVAGRLGNGSSVPSVESLKAYLDNNPMLARWSDEIGRRGAQLDLEHAKSVPDLRVGAGVRQINETDSTALVASVGIPLPIFDRNEGNITAAASRLAKAHSDELAQRDDLLRTLVEAVGELQVAATQLAALKKDVLPVAQTAFDRTKVGYDEGKFDLLNVLDAQRSVFDVKLDLLTARADYEKARVKVESLIGRDINGL